MREKSSILWSGFRKGIHKFGSKPSQNKTVVFLELRHPVPPEVWEKIVKQHIGLQVDTLDTIEMCGGYSTTWLHFVWGCFIMLPPNTITDECYVPHKSATTITPDHIAAFCDINDLFVT